MKTKFFLLFLLFSFASFADKDIIKHYIKNIKDYYFKQGWAFDHIVLRERRFYGNEKIIDGILYYQQDDDLTFSFANLTEHSDSVQIIINEKIKTYKNNNIIILPKTDYDINVKIYLNDSITPNDIVGYVILYQ
jgi:hypothetical protein